MSDLSEYGPWAVIAGGSEGVGRAFAEQLADAGVNLVLIARKPGPLEETAEAVRARGVGVRTLSADLTDRAAITAIQELTVDLEVGLLIYNAGANSYGNEFISGDLDGFQQVIDLNITAPLALVRHYGAAMAEAKRGGILLVGSMSGYLGGPTLSVYSGVKAFGRAWAESLWLEMREYEVDVLELVLGVTRTPAMARAGLDFDVPGIDAADPDDVAREGLANLKNGPIHIAGGNEARVHASSGHNRAELLLGQQRMMKKLLARVPRGGAEA
ncbi:SDR family NAD(P)-dependent oxidoreductase [Gordonia alkaliphila]|uniref:SDR family NAD(P)-dependent oxidoreductase n=1 Tax=Gordonia alkaliphila TaxID=1053547 RepID=UPI001FF2E5C2|nr:SDR family NAD(P)-dependent oxidoreductase [Gordonia alkaliphila]MCK0438942.1 SDR family NAD(P)-dependent oxidoreductase [Gordonia alkaliphila]